MYPFSKVATYLGVNPVYRDRDPKHGVTKWKLYMNRDGDHFASQAADINTYIHPHLVCIIIGNIMNLQFSYLHKSIF